MRLARKVMRNVQATARANDASCPAVSLMDLGGDGIRSRYPTEMTPDGVISSTWSR